ncbi:MAG TPA: hypothetical protein VFT68_08960 [Lapillicoccus sp.]|nr:hypothetical protein [Lapillicoccus sp.]
MPRPDLVTAPTRGDEVVAAASEVIGGPVGRYATRLARGWRYYAAVLAGASAVVSGLGILLRAPCIDTGWSSPDQFWHACFSDLPATYRDAGLSAGIGAYLSGGFGAPAPTQPPLTSFLMTLSATVVPSGDTPDRMRFYFALWAIVAAVLWALTTWWTAGSVRRFPLRAAQVAFAPVALLVLPISPDVVGVALTAAALYAWTRRRPVLTGALLGLAISARTYPLVIVAALLFLCLRTGRMQVWLRTAGAAAVVAGGILFVLGAINPEAAGAAYRAWLDAGAGFGSPWLLPQLGGQPLSATTVTVLCIGGWVVALLVGAGFTLAMPRRPGVAEVSLVMLVIVMLTGKAMTVQSALWLVPLAALVGLAWKDVLIWSAAEALHFEAVWLYLAGTSVPNRGLPAAWYAVFLILRLGGVLWLLGRTWQLALGRPPVLDDDGAVVDSAWGDDESDELAGPLRDDPDRLVVRFG